MTNMDFVSPDNYKVIRRIGVGAMGNVYEGYERGVYYNFARSCPILNASSESNCKSNQ